MTMKMMSLKVFLLSLYLYIEGKQNKYKDVNSSKVVQHIEQIKSLSSCIAKTSNNIGLIRAKVVDKKYNDMKYDEAESKI
jgi:hypothetical protein